MTAIEWLEKRFYFTKGQLIDIDFNQAKAMERSQKAEEYVKGFKDGKEYQIKSDEKNI